MTVTAAVATNLLWTTLGLCIAYLARELGVGTLPEPGPGLLAFACGIAMAVLGLAGGAAQTIWSARRRPPQESSRPAGHLPWPMIGIGVALLVYIAALEPVGFLLATFAFLLVLLLASAAVSRVAALVIAAGVSAGAHVLFKLGLGVQLPAGLLG